MGYVYQIRNTINGKRYVGATRKTIDERWKQHINDYKSQWERLKGRSLYKAFHQYGVDNFVIEEIEKCYDEDLEEMERFYIFRFNTFKNGYNDTLGGAGKEIIDKEKIKQIINAYQKYQNIAEVKRKLKVDKGTIHDILVYYNIPIKTTKDIIIEKFGMAVNMYDLNGKYIKSFTTLSEAARYIIDHNKLKPSVNGIIGHIADVCRGKRKTAYGFTWQFIN